MKEDTINPQKRTNITRGETPISGKGSTKPGTEASHTFTTNDSSSKYSQPQQSSSPNPQGGSNTSSPTSPPQSGARVRSVDEIEAQRNQTARVRPIIDDEGKPKSGFTAHQTIKDAGTPKLSGITGKVSEAQQEYVNKMKTTPQGGKVKMPDGTISKGVVGGTISSPTTINRNSVNIQSSESSSSLAKSSNTSMPKKSGTRLELTPRDTYEIVSGGRNGSTSKIISKAISDGTLVNKANEITGRLTAINKQQLHTSRGYDDSDLGRITTFYGGKRSMTSMNTDNTSRNADRFITESIVTNSQGQTTTDPVLAKKYGLTYVDPKMRNEKFSGFVPKDANSKLAQEQRAWMVETLEREKTELARTVPRTDMDKKQIDTRISELDSQILAIKNGRFDNSLQPMDKYTHRHSFTFQLKDDSGQNLALRRNKAGEIAHKVGLQRYKVVGATNGIAKMTARMALDTVKSQDNMASRGLSTVIGGAELASLLPIWAVNHTVKNYHKDMIDMHLGGLLARDLGRVGGMQVDRVQDIKAYLEQIGFKPGAVKDIMDSNDMQLFARTTLRNHEAGKIKLDEQKVNYLKTIVGGKPVTPSARLNQISKALEAKGFSMDGIRNMKPDMQAKVLKQEYMRVNKLLKKAGKAPLGPEVKSLLKEYHELSKHMAGFSNAKMGIGYTMRLIHQFVIKPLQKYGGEAGQGLATTMQIRSMAKTIIKLNLKLAQSMMRLSAKAAVKAALAATKFKIAGLQRKIDKLRSAGKLGKADKLQKALDKTISTRNKLNGMRKNPLGAVRDKALGRLRETKLGKGVTKAKDTIKKPFQAISDAFKNLWKKTIGRFIPKGPNPVVKAIMQLFQNIGKAIGTVVKPIIGFCSGFLAVVLIIIIVLLTVNTIISAFNIGGQEYDTQQLIVQHLKNNCYLGTFNEIDKVIENKISGDINSRNITFIDIKDYAAYQEWVAQSDEDEHFSQSSNCAEILAMALIKFNFNFGVAKDRLILPGTKYDDRYKSVEDYVEKLWNGSHSIMVTTSADSSTTDSSVNIDIVWTTIYFTGLFDCGLADSMDIQWYESLPREYTYGNLYYYLRESPHNLSHEAAVAIMTSIATKQSRGALLGLDDAVPTSYQIGGKYGMCQWADPKRTNLLDEQESNSRKPENLEGQVIFLMNELTSNYSSLKTTLTSTSNTLEDKLTAFLTEYFVITPETTTNPSGTSSTTPTTSSFETELLVAQNFSDLLAPYKDDPAKRKEDLKPSDGSLIAETAMKYIGHNHYTQGNNKFPGTRLTHYGKGGALNISGVGNGVLGTDCTGFVMYVMSELGYVHEYYSTSAYPLAVGSTAGELVCVWSGKSQRWQSEAEAIAQPGDVIVETGDGVGHALICTFPENGKMQKCDYSGPDCKDSTTHNPGCSGDSSTGSVQGHMNWVTKYHPGATVRLFRLNGT